MRHSSAFGRLVALVLSVGLVVRWVVNSGNAGFSQNLEIRPRGTPIPNAITQVHLVAREDRVVSWR